MVLITRRAALARSIAASQTGVGLGVHTWHGGGDSGSTTGAAPEPLVSRSQVE